MVGLALADVVAFVVDVGGGALVVVGEVVGEPTVVDVEAIVPSVTRYSQNPKTFAANTSRLVMEMIRGTGKIAEHKIMPNFIHGQTLG